MKTFSVVFSKNMEQGVGVFHSLPVGARGNGGFEWELVCLLKAFFLLTLSCEADLQSLHPAFTPSTSQMTGKITHDGAEVGLHSDPKAPMLAPRKNVFKNTLYERLNERIVSQKCIRTTVFFAVLHI